ncbi:DUF4249 family protein [bacterium]|nr:DUF4249 family protein [bacterium]
MKPIFSVMRWALGLTGILSLANCTDVIQVDLPDSEPLVVVDGRMTDLDPVRVKVTTTANYFSQTQTPRIQGARVSLWADGVEVEVLQEDSAGYYSGNTLAQESVNYFVRVETDENDPLLGSGTWESLSERLPRSLGIDSFYVGYLENDPPFVDGWYTYFEFRDPLGVGDKYRLRRTRNDSILDSPFDLSIFQDDFWDGRVFDNVDLPAIRLDGPLDSGTTFELEMAGISERYFEYIALLREQTTQVGGTFDPPPAPLQGNIRDRVAAGKLALGYFSVQRVSRANAAVPE